MNNLTQSATLPAEAQAEQAIELSVIVTVVEKFDDVDNVLLDYIREISTWDTTFEWIAVVDGDHSDTVARLRALVENSDSNGSVVVLPKSFGESTALSVAFEKAQGRYIMTLPAYSQVVSSDLPKLFDAIRQGESDMVVGCRFPRIDGKVNQTQTRLFSWAIGRISGLALRDAGCSVRAFVKEIGDELHLYGDHHRFIPMLAHTNGFKIAEIELRQAEQQRQVRVYAPGLYLRRFLDLATAYFLLKFIKKPFRFFGLVGSTVLGLGGAILAWTTVERLFFGVAMADRPAFLFSALLVVFGLQILAVGLVSEIVIFSQSKDIKEYKIDRIYESDPPP